MEQPTINQVLKKINVLHNHPDVKEKDLASMWLTKFQESPFAWEVSDQLLYQNYNIQASYFAAQTIRKKIQRSFNELPVESHEALRDSLIAHIRAITADTKSIIITQLCLALADLSILIPSWEGPISKLMDMFDYDSTMTTLVVILKFIPEEINCSYFEDLEHHRRKEIVAELKNNAQRVCNFLQMCLMKNQDNPVVIRQVLGCFSSWLTVSVIDLDKNIDNLTLNYALMLMKNMNTESLLYETAADCLCALLQNIETKHTSIEVEKKIFHGICSLQEAFKISISTNQIDKAINIVRVFTVMAESFMAEMIADTSDGSEPHYSIQILGLLAEFASHDYEIAETTFNMWLRLSDELYSGKNDPFLAHFIPHVQNFICALFKLCQMDPIEEGLIEDGEDLSDIREHISEVIKSIVHVVTSKSCFKQMFMVLQQPHITWEATEAALFIMENVARNIVPEENEVISKVVEAILNLPGNCHIAIRYTSIKLLGELSDWIEKHPTSLQSILNFLLHALQQKNQLASAAANSLQEICASCQKDLIGEVKGFMEIARHLNTFDISNTSALNLLKGISGIISRLSVKECTLQLLELANIQCQQLVKILQNTQDTKSDPCVWIARLSAIFYNSKITISVTNQSHPCLTVLETNWSIISQLMTKYYKDIRVMESITRCLRVAIQSIGKHAHPILDVLVNQMLEIYSKHPQGCILYLGSVLVDQFYQEPKFIPGLLYMLQHFIQPTMNLLMQENGGKNNPDLVEDFFRFTNRFITFIPVEFLKSSHIHSIIQCALLVTSLDHREANASVMKFLTKFVECRRKSDELRALVKAVLSIHGEVLISNLLVSSVFHLYSYMLHDVVYVFYELKRLNSKAFEKYLTSAVVSLQKDARANESQIKEFIRKFMMKGDCIQHMLPALKEFSKLFPHK